MHEDVQALIDDVIRPLVEADGGGIELVSVDGKIVTIRMSRACGGCPGAPYTRSGVIEPVLRMALGDGIELRVQRAPTRPGTPRALRETPRGEDDDES